MARRVSRLPEDVIYLLQAAAVAGPECEAGIVAEAAELTTEQRLDAFDRAEESRLLRRVGQDIRDRYVFTHTLVRDAIYGELLRGRRVRYHHKIAVAMERAHADELDTYVNELAHHFSMGAALADADKAVHYCRAAGERALRLLAFEEAAVHFARSLEVAEQYGPRTRRHGATRSSRWRRRRTGPATRRWRTPTSSGRPRWRGPLGDRRAAGRGCAARRPAELPGDRAGERGAGATAGGGLAALPDGEDTSCSAMVDGATRSGHRLRPPMSRPRRRWYAHSP